MKILVVDDHSLITDALSILFLDLDPTAEVITTRTAEGALKIQEEQPELDLVVLDLGMPGVSGTALLEAMVGADGKPKTCERVWISSIGCGKDPQEEQTGKLTAGFGASGW